MNIQKLIDDMETEIEQLREDIKNVHHEASAKAIHAAIDNRNNRIEELKIKYPEYIKR